MQRLDERLQEIRRMIERYCPDERCDTPIPRLSLLRANEPTTAVPAIYQPMLCVIVQGRKQALLGETRFEYGPGNYVIASVDLPVTSDVFEASPEQPYLAFALSLDTTILAELILALPEHPITNRPERGLTVDTLTPDLMDPIVRMLQLLERPQDIAVLAPLAERELLYHLLNGNQGQTLRQIAMADSHLTQISKAISWIKRHHADPLRIDSVAQVANMSPSSFHRHFKAVTAMSPLQYQKQIRLQEARRLLLARHSDAASAGFAVGYQSPSQFNREYARLFGVPPGRDASRLRERSLREDRERSSA